MELHIEPSETPYKSFIDSHSTIKTPDNLTPESRQLLTNIRNNRDRSSQLLQEVNNFISDKESSSLNNGSNPPSLLNHNRFSQKLSQIESNKLMLQTAEYTQLQHQTQLDANGSNDGDLEKAIEEDVAASLINASRTNSFLQTPGRDFSNYGTLPATNKLSK